MMRTKISMKNNFDFTIELYWNDEKRTHNQGILRPGHEINMSSRLGHVFSVAREKSFEGDSEENTDIVDFMVVNGLDYHFQPTNRIETCEVIPDQIPMFVDGDIACRYVICFMNFDCWYIQLDDYLSCLPRVVAGITVLVTCTSDLPSSQIKFGIRSDWG